MNGKNGVDINMKSLSESLFDHNLVSKTLIYHGIDVDSDVWSKCVKFCKERIKEYYSRMDIGDRCVMGDMSNPAELLYKDNECVVFLIYPETDEVQEIYVMCPETVFVRNYYEEIDLSKVEWANDYDIDFCYLREEGKWEDIVYWYDKNSRKRITEWMPEMISNKAKQIIKNYMK